MNLSALTFEASVPELAKMLDSLTTKKGFSGKDSSNSINKTMGCRAIRVTGVEEDGNLNSSPSNKPRPNCDSTITKGDIHLTATGAKGI